MTPWRPLQTYLFWFSVYLSQAVKYPLSLFLLPFLNLFFKCKNKTLIRTKLILKACCWTVNIDIPPTAVLCNSFMFFKCYFIASILKSCSHRCQPYHAWPLVCDLVLSALICWGELSWCIEPAMQKMHKHKKRYVFAKKNQSGVLNVLHSKTSKQATKIKLIIHNNFLFWSARSATIFHLWNGGALSD